jgi:hypothetical protein
MEDVGIFYGRVVNLWLVGIFCVHLVYFMVIWYIFFDVLVCCTTKNLATLLYTDHVMLTQQIVYTRSKLSCATRNQLGTEMTALAFFALEAIFRKLLGLLRYERFFLARRLHDQSDQMSMCKKHPKM